jgi:ATP-dependent RNA helicase RhlE
LYNEKTESKQRLIRTLILTPTRELAIQIEENFLAYSKFTNLKNTVIFG